MDSVTTFLSQPSYSCSISPTALDKDTSKWLNRRFAFQGHQNDNLQVNTIRLCGLLENMCDSTLATDSWCPLVTLHFRTVRVQQNKSAASSAGYLEWSAWSWSGLARSTTTLLTIDEPMLIILWNDLPQHLRQDITWQFSWSYLSHLTLSNTILDHS